MTDKKKIEEMANDIAKICPDLVENCCGQINCVTHLTLSLYKEGYRKQIEGEWIHTDKANHWFGKDECSECHYHDCERIDLMHFNFCPNCGAKMKGGAE